MSDHETVRQLLAFSAAGLLDASEDRLVREHARQCAACAAELDEFAGLSALPCPLPPADLLRRTSTLLAAEADRRQGAVFAGSAAIFAFAFVLLMGQTLRVLVGDSAALAWLLWALVSCVLAPLQPWCWPRARLERSIV
jgi:hypothetical protein